ncbi:DNA recombination protein RmuC [Glutamicibacter endophyticus]
MDALLVVLILVNLAISAFALWMLRAAGGPGLAQRIQDSVRLGNAELRQDLGGQRSELHQSMQRVSESNELRLERIREAVDRSLRESAGAQRELQKVLAAELEKLRQSNESKLEKMRETVDEKLQGTLEKRLGESFGLVSQRLEQVQQGLGEMRSLAEDVGGLKRVLTNVKSRGTWGEVQLERQLADVLTSEQYRQNVQIVPGSSERVEFAVVLPGHEQEVLLPIDSKFPQEDYERLLDARDAGDKASVQAAGNALERAILEQAKLISGKYVAPPYSTDFAIMYLPTEGLFAEVVGRSGLASRLQNGHRVLITGPTTLMSLLNSLQMGFRTLAIEKRTSEVWQVLAAAKAEFRKYGDVWDKLSKQLATAQNTVSEAGTRTRVLERKLKDVETLEPEQPGSLEDVVGLP